MKSKTALAAIVLASIPLQGLGYAAYAQDRVDPAFMSKLEAALEQKPELVLQAAARAQQRQRDAEMQAMNVTASEVRRQLAVADNPGFVIGNPTGSATFIEYLDYRCGYCKRAHDEVNKLISDNPEARVVIVQLPVLGPDSETLARFAIAASIQGKFKQTHNYLYENTVSADEAGLRSAAQAIGLDWAKVQQDMTSANVTGRLAANKSLGEQMNVQGTPFFITPNRVIPGATTADNLSADIG